MSSIETSTNKISSLRIVSADSYMKAPIFGLDPCYSEFRGNEIKQVPIIRIFGTDAVGTKTCAHIHGVFPYLYIPYNGGDGTEDEFDRLAYQIAVSLDKAINISLGQTNSMTQHVFKVMLVKGIPFYGYHRNEHQYLKIHLYNPAFIRRAANLLQNGAIQNRVYQPHESHLPFILQFLIDYNLYGMSFLHVPKSMIKYRQWSQHQQQNIVDKILVQVDPNQILDAKIERMTISECEIDFSAAFILNRFQINVDENVEHANPGIAFIWSDERARRNKLNGTVPVLSQATEETSQDRQASITKSEEFHQEALDRRLEVIRAMEQSGLSESTISGDRTLTSTTTAPRRQFDLNQFLQNSVYPSECLPKNRKLLNASHLIDHLSHSMNQSRHSVIDSNESQPSLDELNESQIDEEFVLNLTQKQSQRTMLSETMNEEELNMLELLEQMEEAEEEQQHEQTIIENDSILAPLTQRSSAQSQRQSQIVAMTQGTKADDDGQNAERSFYEDGSDDDILDDFSLSMIECLSVAAEKTEPQERLRIPQLDGDTDVQAIHKNSKRKVTRASAKRDKKYGEIEITIKHSPIKQSSNIELPKLKTIPITPERIVTNGNIASDEIATLVENCEDEEKTIEIKKVPEQMLSICTPLSVELTRCDHLTSETHPKSGRNDTSSNSPSPPRRYPKRNRVQAVHFATEQHKNLNNKNVAKNRRNRHDSTDFLDTCYNWSKCAVAQRYDTAKNFFPEPGPSTVNYYMDEDLGEYYQPLKVISTSTVTATTNKRAATSKATKAKTNKEDEESDFFASSSGGVSESDEEEKRNKKPNRKRGRVAKLVKKSSSKKSKLSQKQTRREENDDEDIMMKSFYVDSPSMIMTQSPQIDTILPRMNNTPDIDVAKIAQCIPSVIEFDSSPSPSQENLRVTTINGAPKRLDANKSLDLHELPKVVNKRPFYSDPNDVPTSSRIEVGHKMLELSGNSINDCEVFKSQLNVIGLNAWRHMSATIISRKSTPKNGEYRVLLASEKRTKISLARKPPNHSDARAWIQNRFQLRNAVNRSSRNRSLHSSQEHIICETIVIDDDSDNERNTSKDDSIVKSHSEDAKSSPDGGESDNSSSSDVICLGDIADTNGNDHSSQLKVNIYSSANKCKPISLKNSLVQIASEVSTTSPNAIDSSMNLENTLNKSMAPNSSFGISIASLENSYGFKMDLENFQSAKANIEHNYLTILSLEIHVNTRQNLLPDPSHDAIACIFYAIENDVPDDREQCLPRCSNGVIVSTCGFSSPTDKTNTAFGLDVDCTFVETEVELLRHLVALIRKWDPDIFVGYEIEMASWGYVFQRCQNIGFDLVPQISRVPSQKGSKFRMRDEQQQQQQGFPDDENDRNEIDTDFKLHGRILLDVWRLMRSEINLTSYTFENIMFHVLHRRCPLFSRSKLTRLWSQSINRWIVVDYFLSRSKGTLELLDQLDLIGRTCELAKLFGIQFYEVLSRGSQFRVESMMLRIAKPKNLIPLSPSVQQRAHMRSPEYLALILEPHSRFYEDPLIVLDFQSLYPSVIIAYNYCFSTCLGRVEHLGQSQPFEFGASHLRVPFKVIEQLNRRKLINIAPCGAVFVKSSVREGILPRMLREILDTRQMVKKSMKLHKKDKLLQRVLHSRQLGLKLMANVTYGYTAANFSGRMPCVEVGDSVVSKGRETLERAIKMVEANEKWNCKVVYGDTDSLFVLVPGRTRADAFRIGEEIAEAVTKDNPPPIKLKLEKVYQPSFLQTKKRYVGFMYESSDQTTPTYEAKGIETVRRDGCPAVAKILENSLRILFSSCDVSAVKKYVCRQFTKILSGKASIQDLIFAKEFRGIHGYKPGACVPALELTRIARTIDPRAIPRSGERVPYIVVNGPPGLPLIRLVRNPHELLVNDGLKINAIYYITKVIIPPLNRCLLLIGADAHQWFADLPRKTQYLLSLENAANVMNNDDTPRAEQSFSAAQLAKKSTISQYFSTTNCVCDCGGRTQVGICSECLQPNRRQKSVIVLSDKCLRLERQQHLCATICESCCGQRTDIKCLSLDCPVLFMSNRWQRENRQTDFYRQILNERF